MFEEYGAYTVGKGENDEEYKQVQRQRQKERQIRKEKTQAKMLEVAGDTEEAKKYRNRAAQHNRELKKYCEEKGLSYRADRTGTYGYVDKSGKSGIINLDKNYSVKALLEKQDGEMSNGIGNLTESIDNAVNDKIVKLRVNLFDKSDPIYFDVFSVEEEDGFEDICMHGSSDSVQRTIDGKPVNMTAKEFAKFLKSDTSYKGGDIRLAACSVGKGDNSFAQQLSKELGVTVKAPDDDVYYIPDEGIMFVGSPYRNTGTWRIFRNGDEVK